jgi:SAM-dependent methyltransferase
LEAPRTPKPADRGQSAFEEQSVAVGVVAAIPETVAKFRVANRGLRQLFEPPKRDRTRHLRLGTWSRQSIDAVKPVGSEEHCRNCLEGSLQRRRSARIDIVSIIAGIGFGIPMDKLLARLRYALRRHGPAGFIWLAGYNLVYYLFLRDRKASPSRRADLFDEKYGTDTGGVREIGSLDVVNAHAARYAARYDPSNPELVRNQLSRLQLDYGRFTFIDFGSGKGRVLLTAARFPFTEVIGVEFSRELHEIALRNIVRFPPNETRAGSIRSVHGDAGTFKLPQSDLLCYFYNPFGPPVLEAVAARLVAHTERYGYRVIVIYVNPRHRGIFDKTGKFLVMHDAADVVVLTSHQYAASGVTPIC